MSNPAVEEVRI